MEDVFNFLKGSKRPLGQFLMEKDEEFWEDETMKLPVRWQNLEE